MTIKLPTTYDNEVNDAPTKAEPVENLTGPTVWCTRAELGNVLAAAKSPNPDGVSDRVNVAACINDFERYGVCKFWRSWIQHRNGRPGWYADPIEIRDVGVS